MNDNHGIRKTISSEKPVKIFIYTIMVLVTCVTIYPLFYAIGGSFKSIAEFLQGGINIFPREGITLKNYVTAWSQANFGKYTVNSILFTTWSVVFTVSTTSMTGYVLSRESFVGKKLLISILGFMIFLLGAVTIYPIFRISKTLGLLNNLWGMIIAQVAGSQALYIMLIMGYCDGISKEIDEAAHIEGASFFQTFRIIILPIIKPILATVGLLAFRDAWNSFMLPLAFTISKPALRPLTVGVVMLKDQGDGVTAWNLMLAGTIMALVPILLVYGFMNRYFIEGISDGAVKG